MQVPYEPYLATQFSNAYDAYLEIQRHVHLKLQVALGHDTPNYQLLNICPACFYILEGEPELEYSFFCSFDGNNSLKRLGAWMHNMTARADNRSLESDRWLSPAQVNVFKDEVVTKKVTVPQVLGTYY